VLHITEFSVAKVTGERVVVQFAADLLEIHAQKRQIVPLPTQRAHRNGNVHPFRFDARERIAATRFLESTRRMASGGSDSVRLVQ
jgi:hypothetical protein